MPHVKFVTNGTNGIGVKDFWTRVKLCETGQTQAKISQNHWNEIVFEI